MYIGSRHCAGGGFVRHGKQSADQCYFVVFTTPTASLGLWLLLFVAAGTLLGIVASSLIIANYRRKLNRALKKD